MRASIGLLADLISQLRVYVDTGVQVKKLNKTSLVLIKNT